MGKEGEEVQFNMRKILDILLYIILFMGVFTIGWLGNNIYSEWNNQRIYDGLYIKNEVYSNTKEIIGKYDKLGDWVCINIKGMDFKEGIKTCVHECGHAVYSEIYAEECEKDFDKCAEKLR